MQEQSIESGPRPQAPKGLRLSTFRAQGLRWRNLLAQGVVDLATPPANSQARSSIYVLFGPEGPVVRIEGKAGDYALDETVLGVLAADKVDELDIVFSDDSCFDLSFTLPDSPIADLRALIEGEIQYRSPFAANVSKTFWIAEEKPAGGWRVKAAVCLAGPLDKLLEELAGHGLRARFLHRDGKEAQFAARPEWLHPVRAKTNWLQVWRGLTAPLRATVAGSILILLAAGSVWMQTGFQVSEAEARSDAARAELRRHAAQIAQTRAVADMVEGSTQRVAMLGQISALFPDGVWLDQMLIEDGTLTLAGFAPSAAEVTRLLTDLPELTEIRFASPVVRDNAQSIERFRIAADFVGAQP